jgi:hypothetical protein
MFHLSCLVRGPRNLEATTENEARDVIVNRAGGEGIIDRCEKSCERVKVHLNGRSEVIPGSVKDSDAPRVSHHTLLPMGTMNTTKEGEKGFVFIRRAVDQEGERGKLRTEEGKEIRRTYPWD